MNTKLETIINAWETLGIVGKQELTFNLYKENDYKLDLIIGLVNSMKDFNDRKNQTISRELKSLINLLPKSYYNEGNPNNGNYIFNYITITGDDTITLKGVTRIKEDNETFINNIKRLVNSIGKDMNADEHNVYVEEYFGGLQELKIRLWWD